MPKLTSLRKLQSLFVGGEKLMLTSVAANKFNLREIAEMSARHKHAFWKLEQFRVRGTKKSKI